MESRSIPMDFPYLTVLRQGHPEHDQDSFSTFHPHMDVRRRAKLFNSFDALDGFGTCIASKNVPYAYRTDLPQQPVQELNRRLKILQALTYNGRAARQNRVVVRVTHYVPCTDVNSSAFGLMGLNEVEQGICWRVDEINRSLRIGDVDIPFSSLMSIEAERRELFADDKESIGC